MATNYNVTYKINATSNLKEVNALAQNINKNMSAAAKSSSGIGKAAGVALSSTVPLADRTAAENREYGAARGSMGATGAGGRDFARQAEGLGGLVRLYATFAANIFAASMAFNALKRSFEFEQLQKASDAFAISTGKNLSYVAAQMKELASGALTDKAAQSYANYGASAGFTADQLKRLVVVAKGASQALGREFGDAIDRLIRGTGKLEPELLDELGLLTRTKTAGEAYATSIGKTFETLTQFEKTQAFVNAVLEEGEAKFGAVSKAVDVSPFEKLHAAVLNAAVGVGKFINTAIAPLVSLLANNSGMLYGGLIAAILYLAKTALPILNSSAEVGRAALEKRIVQEEKYYSQKSDFATKAARKELELQESTIKELKKNRDADFSESKKAMADLRSSRTIVGTLAKTYTGKLEDFGQSTLKNGKTVEQYLQGQIASKEKYIEVLKLQGRTEEDVYKRATIALERYTVALGNVEHLTQAKAHTAMRAALEEEIAVKTAAAAVKQAEIDKRVAIEDTKRAFQTAKLSGLRSISEAAQFGSFGDAIDKYKKSLKDVIAAKNEANAVSGKLAAGLNNLQVGMYAVRGIVDIATGTIMKFAGAINTAFMVIGTLVLAFELIVSITKGVNQSYEKLIDSQKTFNDVLKTSGDQSVRFNELQNALDGTTKSILQLKEYSSNVFSGINDGIRDITTSFKAFTKDTGWWSGLKDNFSKMWGGDAVTTQVELLRKSIYTALSTVSAEDKSKVEQAILSAIPTAKTIEQALATLSNSSANALVGIGDRLSKNFAKVDIQLKSQTNSLKMAEESWKTLGKEIDEFNKKDEVKDSKYKGMYTALKSIIEQYKTANTEVDRQNILAALTTGEMDKLKKLAKDHNVDLSETVRLHNEAKTAVEGRVAAEKEAAKQAEATNLKRAVGLLPQDQITNLQVQLNNIERLKREVETAASRDKTGYDELRPRQRELQTAVDKYYSSWNKLMEDSALKNMPELQAAFRARGAIMMQSMLEGMEGFRGKIEETLNKLPKPTVSWKSAAELPAPPAPKIKIPEVSRQERDALFNASDLPRGSAVKEMNSLADALAKKHSEVHEKLSKYYEFRVQEAKKELDVIKSIADVQKEMIGFVSERVQQEVLSKQNNIAYAEYDKRMAEIRLEEAKTLGDKEKVSKAIVSYKIQEEKVTRDILATALLNNQIESIKATFIRDRVKAEEFYFGLLTKSLDILTDINKFSKEAGLISETKANLVDIELKFEKELLGIEKERYLQANKVAEARAIFDKNGSKEAKAALDYAEEHLGKLDQVRTLKEKQLKLEYEISKQLELHKDYIATAARYQEAIIGSLSAQAEFGQEITNQAERNYLVQVATNTILITQAEKYREISLNITDAAVRDAELTKLAIDSHNKLLEIKTKQYEIDSRSVDDSKLVDVMSTGFEIAAQNAQKKAVGLARIMVDGVTQGISSAVDLIFQKMKDGAKLSFKDISQAFGKTFRDILFQGFADELKAKILKFITGIDPKAEVNELKVAIIEQKDKIVEQVATTKDLISELQHLRNSIGNLSTKLYNINKSSTIPLSRQERDASENYTTKISDSLVTAIGDATEPANTYYNLKTTETANNVEKLGDTILNTAGKLWSFGGMLTSMFGVFSKTGSTIGKALSSITSSDFISGLGSFASTVKDWFSGSSSIPHTTSEGSISGRDVGDRGAGTTSTEAGFGQILGGASTGYAVGSFLNSVLGNSRNQTGMAVGGTVGGMAGTVVGTSIGGPLGGTIGSFIGAAIGSAIGSFFKSGGGAKTGGYGTTGNISGERYFTPNQEDSLATKIAGGVKAGYSAAIVAAGGTAAKANFAIGFDTDPKGTANSRVRGGAYINGQQIAGINAEAGRTPEELQAALELQGSKLILSALKHSSLPENVAAYLNTITEEAISSMNKDEIQKKLDFTSVLGTIAKNRAAIEATFGEDLFNLTEEKLQSLSNGTETLSETFTRLNNVFTLTNTVAKSFGLNIKEVFKGVGLATTELRQAFIDGAGGIDNFSNQFNYFMENFYTETERSSIAFGIAVDTTRSNFETLTETFGVTLPTSVTAFRDLVTTAFKDGNVVLYNQLMSVAPAFYAVAGAIQKTKESIDATISSLSESILNDIQTNEQKYNRYKTAADGAQAELDKYMAMGSEELAKSDPAAILKLTNDAAENAQKAWSQLAEDQKKALGPQFLTFLDNLQSNSNIILDKIGQAALTLPTAEGTKSTIPVDTSAGTVALESVSTNFVNSIVAGFALAGDTFVSKVTSVFGMSSSTDLINTGAVAAVDTTDATKQQVKSDEAIVSKQQAMFDTFLSKITDAAVGLQNAAVNIQTATATPKEVSVSVNVSSSPDLISEVGIG